MLELAWKRSPVLPRARLIGAPLAGAEAKVVRFNERLVLG
jgi:hypothetical protein